MTETISYMQQTLNACYPSGETKAFIRLILERVCHLQPHQLLLCKDKELSETEKKEIHRIVERLVKQEPIQYIFGITDFGGLEFFVNPSVLIPRPETAELIELIAHDYADCSIRLLDIGTGSGCIAISLKKRLPNADVAALDISPEALQVAQRNAAHNQVAVTFIQGDILQPENIPDSLPTPLDVIVSNPPYIMEQEKEEMEQNVLDYEPSLALFVPDNDPLRFYRHIAHFALQQLKPTGHLYFEINAQMGEATVELLRGMGFRQVELRQDIFGKDRIVKAQL